LVQIEIDQARIPPLRKRSGGITCEIDASAVREARLEQTGRPNTHHARG
jgi:hypothetical protein